MVTTVNFDVCNTKFLPRYLTLNGALCFRLNNFLVMGINTNFTCRICLENGANINVFLNPKETRRSVKVACHAMMSVLFSFAVSIFLFSIFVSYMKFMSLAKPHN